MRASRSQVCKSPKLGLVVAIIAVGVLCGFAARTNAQTADSFNPNTGVVNAVAVQPDGKVLLGGTFSSVGGTTRRRIARVNADGSLDLSFDPGVNNSVATLAIQPDGKILVGGGFDKIGGGGTGNTTRNRLARLNADGTVDTSFDPGADFAVFALAIQPDGKILVGGSFTTLGGGGTGTTTRNNWGRLNADGSLDTGFNPGANQAVESLAVQLDGKIVVGGGFTGLGGGTGTTPRHCIGRVDANGTLDTDFNPGVWYQTNSNCSGGSVRALAIEPDGQILITGAFHKAGSGGGGAVRWSTARVNADGSLDAGFDVGANGVINSLGLQADGKIMMGGLFFLFGGGSNGNNVRQSIGRVQSDGSLDTGFDAGLCCSSGVGTQGALYSLVLQPDGKVLVGGNFSMLGGGGTGNTPRNSAGRLTNTDAATQSLTATSSTVTWLRSGSSPELSWVRFESSTNAGATYTTVGHGSRITGGWQLTGLSLPSGPNVRVRARGVYSDGRSSSIEDSVTTVPAANVPPVDLNGDGSGDAFIYSSSSGSWWRENALAGGGFQENSGGWAPGWSILPANFDGDALTDMFLFSTTNGNWFKLLNDGTGFTTQSNGTWWNGWERYVMDLDGDGTSDVFLYDPASGSWFKCISTPTGFTYIQGAWTPGWEIYPLKFNNDALEDFFLFSRSNGEWYWALSGAGAGFTYPQHSFWQTDWKFYPGDYNGDGLTDMLLHRSSTGKYYVGLTTAGGWTFTDSSWAAGWTPWVVDLDANGVQDLFLYNKPNGSWVQLLSNGLGAFSQVGIGFWTPNWDLYATDFNADSRTDLLLYSPTTGQYYQAWNLLLGSFAYYSGAWSTGLTIVAGPPIR